MRRLLFLSAIALAGCALEVPEQAVSDALARPQIDGAEETSHRQEDGEFRGGRSDPWVVETIYSVEREGTCTALANLIKNGVAGGWDLFTQPEISSTLPSTEFPTQWAGNRRFEERSWGEVSILVYPDYGVGENGWALSRLDVENPEAFERVLLTVRITNGPNLDVPRITPEGYEPPTKVPAQEHLAEVCSDFPL